MQRGVEGKRRNQASRISGDYWYKLRWIVLVTIWTCKVAVKEATICRAMFYINSRELCAYVKLKMSKWVSKECLPDEKKNPILVFLEFFGPSWITGGSSKSSGTIKLEHIQTCRNHTTKHHAVTIIAAACAVSEYPHWPGGSMCTQYIENWVEVNLLSSWICFPLPRHRDVPNLGNGKESM